jgi:hypothetical protein
MGVGARRDRAHDHTPLGRGQLRVRPLSDHRPAVQGDRLGHVVVHLVCLLTLGSLKGQEA